MDISTIIAIAGVAVVPVSGYVTYVRSEFSKVHQRINDRVLKTDHEREMGEVKDLLTEMRGDIKSLLGRPHR